MSQEPTSYESSSTVASERVAAFLREMIVSGELLPGTRIRQEDVASRLGSSRLPVREALRTLEAEGLVTLKANSGAWVSRIDLREGKAIYRLRVRVEPLVLAESIPYLTAADHAELERIQIEIEHVRDVETFLILDRELHRLTYSACPIAVLTSMTDRFWNMTQHYRRAFSTVTGGQRQWVVNAEHRLLIDAIKRYDADAASRFIAAHIYRTYRELEQHPEVFAAMDDSGLTTASDVSPTFVWEDFPEGEPGGF